MNLWPTVILTARVGALIAFGLCAFPYMHGALHITEFLADNGGSRLDSDGDASDWIEIFNSGPDTTELGGCYLTDMEDALTQWRFPAVQLTAGGFLIVYASGKLSLIHI